MKFLRVSCILLFSVQVTAQSITDRVLEAGELFEKGEYAKAIPLAEKVADEVEKLIGKDNIIYQGMLTIQAYGYFKTFQYKKSEKLFKQLCELHQKSADKERDQHYSACLNNLSNLYTEMGRYEDAELLMIQSLDITKKIYGENDSTYTYSLNNLAGLYQSMGQYQKAEPLYIQAKEIRKRIYGINHPGYANSLNNLGTLYLEMGLLNKAEPLFTEAMQIRKKTLGTSSPEYAMSLSNLGALYEEIKQFDKAEAFYQEANSVRKKVLGESHPDYALGINNLASLYANMKQYKKSEENLLQAKDIWKRVFGESSLNYAIVLNNLGALYRKALINYKQAEGYYQQSLNIRKKLLGENHPLVRDVENDLALLYVHMKQYEKAKPLFLTSSQTMMNNLLRSFSILSENEKNSFINENFFFSDCNNSFLYLNKSSTPDIFVNDANLQLFFKSLSLADTKKMLDLVRKSKDTSVQRIFKDWQANRLLLTKQYALPISSRMPDLKMLENETENLEKELNRKSTAFRDQQLSLKTNTAEVSAKLENNEAAIEFVRFRLYRDGWTDSLLYAAYILKAKDSVPVFIPLCEEKQLQSLFDSAGRTATAMVNSFYRGLELKNKNSGLLGKELYQLVWAPLLPYLKGRNKISYSPSGKLFNIAFHALPVDSVTLVSDKFELHQYTSIRQIAFRSLNNMSQKPISISLFGDPDFSSDKSVISKQRNNTTSTNISATLLNDIRGAGSNEWPRLYGTAEEVKKIKQLFDQNKTTASLFMQADATEENLKSLNSKATQIIHIATHGFFLQLPDKNKRQTGFANQNAYSLADDPLLRSGLILAGGNNAWNGKLPSNGTEDGILTAYEISQIDLSKTELVVLSACETALGDVKGSEGVFGLQRAFKLAGVDKMIVSLWQVPDKETAELMTSFYGYWLNGKSIYQAFRQAQADMRLKYPPFYWAAFVLIE